MLQACVRWATFPIAQVRSFIGTTIRRISRRRRLTGSSPQSTITAIRFPKYKRREHSELPKARRERVERGRQHLKSELGRFSCGFPVYMIGHLAVKINSGIADTHGLTTRRVVDSAGKKRIDQVQPIRREFAEYRDVCELIVH